MVSKEQEVESVEEAAGKSGFLDLFDLLLSLLCGLSVRVHDQSLFFFFLFFKYVAFRVHDQVTFFFFFFLVCCLSGT